MSLTNKWYEILNILLVKRRVTVEELMTLTDLSKQTLRKTFNYSMTVYGKRLKS